LKERPLQPVNSANVINQGEVQVNQQIHKEIPPPPINILNVSEYETIKKIVKLVPNDKYKVTALNNNVWKVNALDPETYRMLSNAITAQNIEWFTYENKAEQPIKVMARGLHHTCPNEEIIEELSQKGFKILNAVNILKRKVTKNANGERETTKVGLPLFMLTFDNTESIDRVYGIKAILNMKVKIETLKKNTSRMPQCYNCQAYNHTRKYCNREPRCVKCAGKHLSKECNKSKNEPVKCIHCGNHHPANYRGCEVAKELQRMRDNKRNQTSKSSQPRMQSYPKQIPLNSAKVREGITYAEMAKQNENTKASSQENHVLQDILQKLNSINSHLTAQDQRLESMGELLKKQEQRLETLENTSMTQDNRITAASSKTCEIIDYLHSSPYKLNKKK
jgi:hypothetical protein